MKRRWQLLKVGMIVGLAGLTGCDEGSSKDGTVFERNGDRAAAIVPIEQNPPHGGPLSISALFEALTEEDPFARAQHLGSLLPTLGPGSVPQVKAIFKDPLLSRYISATETELLTRYWAMHDPEAASTWAVEKSPKAYRTAAVFSAFPLWAKIDPVAALDAADRWMQRKDVRDTLPVTLILGWYAGGDPPELQTYMRNLGVSFGRQRALSTYVRAKLRAEGADAVMRWAESISDEEGLYKLAAYRQVAFGVAPYDLDAALIWCQAHCIGPYGKGLRRMVVQGWLQTDPPAALEWITNAPEGDEARFTLRVAFASWMQIDTESAMQWIADRSIDGPPAMLIPTYPIYARALAKESPDRAIPFAELISDEIDREALLVAMAAAWRAQDEAACDAWLDQSPLSEEARERVRGSEMSTVPPDSIE